MCRSVRRVFFCAFPGLWSAWFVFLLIKKKPRLRALHVHRATHSYPLGVLVVARRQRPLLLLLPLPLPTAEILGHLGGADGVDELLGNALRRCLRLLRSEPSRAKLAVFFFLLFPLFRVGRKVVANQRIVLSSGAPLTTVRSSHASNTSPAHQYVPAFCFPVFFPLLPRTPSQQLNRTSMR